MNIQKKVILFCYAYIVGLVVAMTLPVNPVWMGLLHGVVLAAAALAAFCLWRSRDEETGRWTRWALTALVMAGTALGYTRHLTANTVPDTLIGRVLLQPGGPGFLLDEELPDTSRLRFQKSAAVTEDVRLRIHGALDARVPVRDDAGRPTLDEHGRWRFALAPMGITSEVITVRAEDPVGTDYVVPQPFTRIASIEVLSGPPAATVALYRISNHIGSFVRPGRAQSPVTILGRISGDPLVYDFKTVLPVTPAFIQYPAGGPFFKVEGGDIQVSLRPEMAGYTNYAATSAYGHDLYFSGELTAARGAANPGGFNARRFMQNGNIFGLVSVYAPRSGPPPIGVVTLPDGRARGAGGLVRFSLDLRDRVLGIVKQTIPFPHSAFIGGVTLGMRYGMQGVECMYSHRYLKPGETPHGPGCEETIADEFKEAGVNHVLAVSGLHVTIITVMFVGIFSLLRVPRQAYVPLIVLALVVFAVITGARPSTLRAVIMNSLFLMSWAYLDQSLRASVLVGVPVAAFLILLHNPLVVVDPSFTLSFGAILSLALLTGPSLDLLQRLRGNQFVLALLLGVGISWLAVVHWPLVVTPQFLLPAGALVAALFVWMGRLQQRGIGVPDRINWNTIPSGIGAFLGAQFAIQIGMMIPLSAFYFSRWPFAGAYANLIAIPLIGVNVQLGAIGGLLGLVPVVGPWIALLLGAANWVFCVVFLWIAHASAEVWPYPFVRRPGILFVAAYYALCAWWIWRAPIWTWLVKTSARFSTSRRTPQAAAAAALAVLAALLALDLRAEKPAGLRMTFLSVGYGSSVLIESPGGARILADTGFVEHEMGRRNEALRTVIPYLAHRNIRKLDALILTSPRPERIGGAGHVLEHLWVGRVIVPPSLAGLQPGETFDAFIGRFDDALDVLEPSVLETSHAELTGDAEHPRRPSYAGMLAKRGATPLNRWAGWTAAEETVQAGQVLFEEKGPGGVFRIEVVSPGPDTPAARSFDNGSLVLRVVYGGFACLLTGDLSHDAVAALAAQAGPDKLRANVVTLPHRGTAPAPWVSEFKGSLKGALEQGLVALLNAAGADRVIAEYGNPRSVLGEAARTSADTHLLAKRVVEDKLGAEAWLSTDTDLAITLESDGKGYTLATQAEANRAEGGVDDAVSDLAVGL